MKQVGGSGAPDPKRILPAQPVFPDQAVMSPGEEVVTRQCFRIRRGEVSSAIETSSVEKEKEKGLSEREVETGGLAELREERREIYGKWYEKYDHKLSKPNRAAMGKGEARAFVEHARACFVYFDDLERSEIEGLLVDIVRTKSGASVLSKILNSGWSVDFFVTKSGETEVRFPKASQQICNLRFNIAVDTYCEAVLRNGELHYFKIDPRTRLFHELKHCLDEITSANVYATGPTYLNMSEPQLVEQRFHNINEQRTIMGFDGKRWSAECHNVFQIELAKLDPSAVEFISISHEGVIVPKGQPLNLSDLCAFPSAVDEVKAIIDDNLEALNQTYVSYYGDTLLRIRPLTNAVLHENLAAIEILLARENTEVSYIDDVGVPIQAAYYYGRSDVADKMCLHPNFHLFEPVMVLQWKRCLLQIREASGGQESYYYDFAGRRDWNSLYAISHGLDATFREVRDKAGDIIDDVNDRLLRWNDNGSAFDSELLIEFADAFYDVAARSHDVAERAPWFDVKDVDMVLFNYLSTIDEDTLLGCIVDDWLEMIAGRSNESYVKFLEHLEGFQPLEIVFGIMQQVARSLIVNSDREPNGEAEVLSVADFSSEKEDDTEALLASVEDPANMSGIDIKKEIAGGVEHVAGVLFENWVVAKALLLLLEKARSRGNSFLS